MGAPNFPAQSDGNKFLRNPVLRCFNILSGGNPKTYHFIDDDIKTKGFNVNHSLDNDGTKVGGFSQDTGDKVGSITMQYDKATDTDIVPGFLIGLNKGLAAGEEYYRVTTDDGESAKRNDLKRAKIPVENMVNPVSLNQGALGNYNTATCSNAGADVTFDPKFANFRAGTVKTYAGLSSDGTALPVGVTVNAGSGVVTIAHLTAVIGVYEIIVTATDTLAGSSLVREGTITLGITVTA